MNRRSLPCRLPTQASSVAAAVCLAILWHGLLAHAEEKPTPAPLQPRDPDRRELWVPTDRLAEVLKQHPKAVLLSREEYDALLRDSEPGVKPPPKPPIQEAFSGAAYTGKVTGKVFQVHAQFTIHVFSEGWAELPLPFGAASLGEITVDGDSAISAAAHATKDEAPAPDPRLLIRGVGEHVISIDLSAPIEMGASGSKIHLQLPPAASGLFLVELPAHSTVESPQPFKLESLADVTRVSAAIAASHPELSLAWHGGADPAHALAPHILTAIVHTIDGEHLRTACLLTMTAVLGPLPRQLQIDVPPECTAIEVSGDTVAAWSAEPGRITATLLPGAPFEAAIRLVLDQPSLAGAAHATRLLPTPKLTGFPSDAGGVEVRAEDGVEVRAVSPGPGAAQLPPQPGAIADWSFTGPAPECRVELDRFVPRFSADVDTVVDFQLDAVHIERTVTLHEEKGRLFHLEITVPSGEEILAIKTCGAGAKSVSDEDADWRIQGGKIHLRWSGLLPPGQQRVFTIQSRAEPDNWTHLTPDGVAYILGDAHVDGAANVSGYIALRADDTFRLEAKPSDSLERRDPRTTPIHGEYAWFHREAFSLPVHVFRKPSETIATLTGYALPLEGILDVHAQIAWEFLHSGVRSVRIRVPAAIASQFYFDGPQIAERNLIGDVWSIVFQKELTGGYLMSVTAQAPSTQAEQKGEESRFTVEVPEIEPLNVMRTSGIWAIEANTETDIDITSQGASELDALSAPPLPGYKPVHRVIGVFGWLGAKYHIALYGVRHPAAHVVNTVVDDMQLVSVASTSGVIRTEAGLAVRTAGAQFLDITLPAASHLLSLLLEGAPAKPVAGPAGRVRVELPAIEHASKDIAVTLLFETPAKEWRDAGKTQIFAPRLGVDIPVLRSSWRLFLPDGFTYSALDSNLEKPEELHDRPLLLRPLDLWDAWQAHRFLAEKQSILGNSGISDPRALEMAVSKLTVRQKQIALDSDPKALDGRPDLDAMVMDAEAKPGESAPEGAAEPFVTRSWKLPPSIFQNPGSGKPTYLSAKDGLSAQGVQFPPGSSAVYSPSSQTLYIKNTQSNVDSVDAILSAGVQDGREEKLSKEALAGAKLPQAQWRSQPGLIATVGLLPIKLDLPRSGSEITLQGLIAPDRVRFHFEDWWARARRLWFYLVLGGAAFFIAGSRRPLWNALWATLLLTAIPLCLASTAAAACNALLLGWLLALIFNQLARHWAFIPRPLPAAVVPA